MLFLFMLALIVAGKLHDQNELKYTTDNIRLLR